MPPKYTTDHKLDVGLGMLYTHGPGMKLWERIVGSVVQKL